MLFSAKLIFDLQVLPASSDRGVREERIIMIYAPDEAAARDRAIEFGKRSEHQYEAADGGTVSVTLVEVGKVYLLHSENLEDGLEVFSEYL